MSYPTVHTINLAHRHDRKEHFLNQFQEQGITDYKIWPGIIDPQIPMRGISRAHKAIVRDAAIRQLSEVCIMEDDCFFLGFKAFDYFVQNKPKDYSLYLGGLSNGHINKDNTVSNFRGMTLYFIHESFYYTFLNLDERKHIDAELTGKGIYYVCQPIVCSQIAGFSDQKKKWNSYDHLLKQYKCYENSQSNTPPPQDLPLHK